MEQINRIVYSGDRTVGEINKLETHIGEIHDQLMEQRRNDRKQKKSSKKRKKKEKKCHKKKKKKESGRVERVPKIDWACERGSDKVPQERKKGHLG